MDPIEEDAVVDTPDIDEAADLEALTPDDEGETKEDSQG